ncbi:UDP-N-acetylmuramate dehydrogenase [Antarcticibacterium arcticum]|uniref:UDP-N-acetylenolpyruvoylglucosamine reductase n=1 Tax=Antarcticibacterium arcticum TaxID=2585771 RepID=A0A5B8YIR3_9FLAO|nr:UDP-N-acetylmuramate dehydrogenase [Antarcticibacterium arcticum]QED36286.1 UDP-N-acetylmuramate dehydrogenase [Antarcticibacterium arcticum]
MKILQNASLKDHNTFGIDVKAKTFISVETIEELREVLKQNYSEDILVLGGGSNMLLTGDIDATVLHIGLKGKEIVRETEEDVFIKVQGGENWHETVLYTLENNWGGLENLSLIPGNIGTAPIQNIGAYGVELKDTFFSCEAIDMQTLEMKEFDNSSCQFDYRSSIFKLAVKGKYIITSVTFRLTKKEHRLHTNYGSIQEALDEMGVVNAGIKDVSNAVIKIRSQKLPDPKKLGNSGSFFKNPVITVAALDNLKNKFSGIPSYQVSDTEFKVPAGWLIENVGLKGYREGDAGVHKNQALVLVNYGAATGKEILNLAKKIQAEVYEKFGIELQPEVNII